VKPTARWYNAVMDWEKGNQSSFERLGSFFRVPTGLKLGMLWIRKKHNKTLFASPPLLTILLKIFEIREKLRSEC